MATQCELLEFWFFLMPALFIVNKFLCLSRLSLRIFHIFFILALYFHVSWLIFGIFFFFLFTIHIDSLMIFVVTVWFALEILLYLVTQKNGEPFPLYEWGVYLTHSHSHMCVFFQIASKPRR